MNGEQKNQLLQRQGQYLLIVCYSKNLAYLLPDERGF
jgi:hypothetical protein